MKRNFKTFLRKFASEEEGSIAVLGAAFVLFAIVSIGIALDYARLSGVSGKLKNLTDNATLAAAKDPDLTLEERKEIFENLMNHGMSISEEIPNYTYSLSFTESDEKIVLQANTTTEPELFFYRNHMDTIGVHDESEVTYGKENIEVTMVLDISSSMAGSRITELQDSAKLFIAAILEDTEIRDRVSIAIVPYGGTVRLPDQMEHMLIQPATTAHWFNGTWNGCLDSRPSDYISGLVPSQNMDYLPEAYTWNEGNPWCPPAGNEIMGLTNDQDALEAKIDAFTLSDGTGTDIGVAWGFATLDPAFRGSIPDVDSELPKDFNAGTKKIMIVMTDGGITFQNSPTAAQMTGTLPYWTRRKIVTTNEAKAGYQIICDLAKTNDIQVYTVGFSLRNTSQENTLKACATDDTHHYEANLGELETVFKNLANSVSSLRLSN